MTMLEPTSTIRFALEEVGGDRIYRVRDIPVDAIPPVPRVGDFTSWFRVGYIVQSVLWDYAEAATLERITVRMVKP